MRTFVAQNPGPTPAADILCCPPQALGALGPLLCLHDAADPHLMTGWRRAQHLLAEVHLDSDGPCEALRFYDAAGQCCWRLYLLPDSDFHAWERLLAALPVLSEGWRAAPRVWAGRHGGSACWQASPLRLHAIAGSSATQGVQLAAADVELSPLGAACARRIAHHSGAFAGVGRNGPHRRDAH